MNRNTLSSLYLFAALTLQIWSLPAAGAEVYASIGERTTFNSNVYMDSSEEWDVIISPSGSLSVEFGDIYATGYNGYLEVYPRHSDLLFHTHELYFLANPAFGENDEHGFIGELSVTTHKNTSQFSALNLVEPTLFLDLSLTQFNWLSWSISETVSYGWFYEDTQSDGLNTWTRAEVRFTAPTRTTIAPRVLYGLRYYPRLQSPISSDPVDQQIEAGLHLSQNLFEGVGLRMDYAYIHGLGDSALVRRNIDEADFLFLGEAFLYTGHQALAGIKFLFENGLGIDAAVTYADKHYNGWPARDMLGNITEDTRYDRALGPESALSFNWSPAEDASPAVPVLDIALSYGFLRNWSNDIWYDTVRHRVSLGLELSW